jgi:AcrR family transcriptional regulator
MSKRLPARGTSNPASSTAGVAPTRTSTPVPSARRASPPASRPALSRARIVDAAAALVDREGAEALSARRLAGELGCEAMSLYHHVPNMGELLDAVVDQALGALPLPEADTAAPGAALRAMTDAYLGLAGMRPHTFRVLATHRWRTPAEIAYQSRLIELLVHVGHAPRAALRASRVLLVYLNGGGLAIAIWAQDMRHVSVERTTPVVRKLMKFSTAPAVARDVRSGLTLLLEALLPASRASARQRGAR